MIDTTVVNRSVNLLEMAKQYTQLTWAASTGGGEYKGACPFCPDHGEDRFRVQPNQQPHGIWMCRRCTDGKWKDPIEFALRLWPQVDFREVCERLAKSKLPVNNHGKSRSLQTAYQPSGTEWQESARQAITICQKNLCLEMGGTALKYLQVRGLTIKTINSFALGFSPGATFGSLYVPSGVVIPCIIADDVWYLKVSLLPGQIVRCEGCGIQTQARSLCHNCGKVNKYRGVRGNRPAAIFNGDWLRGIDYAFFCEGEFDAMIAHQEINDVLPCVTVGSAGNHLDLATWGRYLLPLKHILVAYDNDSAGRSGTAVFERMTSRVYPITLPDGVKDINEWYLSGGNLWRWIQPILDELAP